MTVTIDQRHEVSTHCFVIQYCSAHQLCVTSACRDACSHSFIGHLPPLDGPRAHPNKFPQSGLNAHSCQVYNFASVLQFHRFDPTMPRYLDTIIICEIDGTLESWGVVGLLLSHSQNARRVPLPINMTGLIYWFDFFLPFYLE